MRESENREVHTPATQNWRVRRGEGKGGKKSLGERPKIEAAVLVGRQDSLLVSRLLTGPICPLSSGFFYSIFRGRAGVGVDVLSLPGGPEARGFAPLLDFMYTSRLRLSPATAPAVLAAATYLQMEHVVQACHRFIQAR